MRGVAVLQARTSSSRLPGKVLLPICGIPVAVLAAKRAANTGRHVIVATSSEESDDGLADVLRQHGLSCFRGSLENTLSRIVGALEEFDDSTIVFRLTGDNVVPDGALLDELEEAFIDGAHEYLCSNGMSSGLPYGMSAEVTRLAHLRDALKESVDAYDLEHVTPYVVRKFGSHFYEKHKGSGWGHFRCTIDCLDDYLGMQKLFSGIADPVSVNAFTLIARLQGQHFQPLVAAPVPRLVLGTAQLGVSYGIANKRGRPGLPESQRLLKTAISNGVTYIDTARAYGDSEAVIGRALSDGWFGRAKIITKLSPMTDCPPDAASSVVNAFVDASIYQSLSALNVKRLDVVLLHRASHLADWQGAVWLRLLEHQRSGLVGELGVSLQTPEECLMVLDIEGVRHIQMPLNVFDWRWDDVIPYIVEAKLRRKLVVHVRSVLLQGLITSNEQALWQRAHVSNYQVVSAWLTTCTAEFGRRSIADFCISFVSALSWVDGVVLGMETLEQLIENMDLFDREPLSLADVEKVVRFRPRLSMESLNPAFWKTC